MRVLVIPDIHLKPWMFDSAMKLLNSSIADQAVCLGDLPDDFGKQSNIGLYEDTFDAAINFAKQFPSTLWCYGNHDVCYKWNHRETGYSKLAALIVKPKLGELEAAVGEHIKFIHKIDNAIFSHAGLSDAFVSYLVKLKDKRNVDFVLDAINYAPPSTLWTDISPIWFRPQIQTYVRTYYPRKFLQVVGHTPVKQPYKHHGVLSCDVFSTYRDGTPYGDQKFVVVDTVTKEFESI